MVVFLQGERGVYMSKRSNKVSTADYQPTQKNCYNKERRSSLDKFNFECKIDNIELNNLNLTGNFQRLHYRKYAGRKTKFLVEKPVYVSLRKNQK
jgi:hypothetical protein